MLKQIAFRNIQKVVIFDDPYFLKQIPLKIRFAGKPKKLMFAKFSTEWNTSKIAAKMKGLQVNSKTRHLRAKSSDFALIKPKAFQ